MKSRGKIEYRARAILSNFKEGLASPASLSGKFHLSETIEQHLERCVNIMEYLCDAFKIEGEDRDLLIAAILLHDIGKFVITQKGTSSRFLWVNYKSGFTRVDQLMKIHPIIGSMLLTELDLPRKKEIQRLVSVHMGNHYKNNHNPRPNNLFEYLICLADFLSSRGGDLFKHERRAETKLKKEKS